MGTAFWIRRFLTVFALAFAVIGGAQLLKGRPLGYAMIQGLVWSSVSSVIFTAARLYHSHHGRHCALCRDIPEMLVDPPQDRPG